MAILSVLVGGTLTMRMVGLRGWALVPVGFVAGTGLYLAIGFLHVVLPGVTTSPILTIVLTAAVPGIVWVSQTARGKDVGVSPWWTLSTLAGVASAVMALRGARLLAWHVDSHVYLEMGGLLARGLFDVNPSNYLLTARMLGIPLVHAPASLTNDYYLRSAVPLLAAATVGLVVWLFLQGARRLVDRKTLLILAALGVALLVTANRFVYHAFYVNGHLMTGTFVLALAGTAWVLATRQTVPNGPLVALHLLVIPGLVITRPEGALMAAIAILPMLLSPVISALVRAASIATLGASIIVWNGYVHLLLASDGVDSEWSTKGMLGVGVAMCVTAIAIRLLPLLRDGFAAPAATHVIGAAELSMWLALAAFTIRDPAIMQRSIPATAKNQIVAGWGVTVLGIIAFCVLAVFLLRSSRTTFLRFPVTTFLPLVFLLAYLREGGYRVGPTDSLNRMWIQMVPLAVLYVIAAIATGKDQPESDTEPEPDTKPDSAQRPPQEAKTPASL